MKAIGWMVIGIVALMLFTLWVAWWATGQFFEGKEHVAAFVILAFLASPKK